MSISFSGSTLTFSDSTTMTTAAVAGPPGPTGPAGSPSNVAGPTGSPGPTGPAGSSGSTLISSVNMAGASTVCFTGLSSSYKYYILTWDGVSASTAQNMILRVSTNNGSSYISCSLYGGDTRASNYALLTSSYMCFSYIENHSVIPSSGHLAHGYAFLHGLATSTTMFGAVGRTAEVTYACCQYNIRVNPRFVTGAANISSVNAIRLYPSSGTFSTGKMSLYGVP